MGPYLARHQSVLCGRLCLLRLCVPTDCVYMFMPMTHSTLRTQHVRAAQRKIVLALKTEKK